MEDPRYCLTPEENEGVKLLKRACEKEGVSYKSDFELAKYFLVTSSLGDTAKQVREALARLKKKRKFEYKYSLDDFDVIECAKVLEEHMPEWQSPCAVIGGKQVVGYTSHGADGNFFVTYPNAFEIICKAEMTRFDLAAADLVEARNGFYVVGTAKNMKSEVWPALKMAFGLRVLVDKMHANRIKGIYYEAPSHLVRIGKAFMRFVPKKLLGRLSYGDDITKMAICTDQPEEFVAGVPEMLGGKFSKTLTSWLKERGDYYDKTVELVKVIED